MAGLADWVVVFCLPYSKVFYGFSMFFLRKHVNNVFSRLSEANLSPRLAAISKTTSFERLASSSLLKLPTIKHHEWSQRLGTAEVLYMWCRLWWPKRSAELQTERTIVLQYSLAMIESFHSRMIPFKMLRDMKELMNPSQFGGKPIKSPLKNPWDHWTIPWKLLDPGSWKVSCHEIRKSLAGKHRPGPSQQVFLPTWKEQIYMYKRLI